MRRDAAPCRLDALLPEYAAGSLAAADGDRVRAHLAGCARCRADLAAWQAIAAGLSPAHQGAPEPAPLIREALTRSALGGGLDSALDGRLDSALGGGLDSALGGGLDDPAPGLRGLRHIRYVAALVLAEARLIRLAVPVASALVMALGVGLVLLGGAASGAGSGAGAGGSGSAAGTGAAGNLLALVAPIVAAAGVAGAYRSRRDPAAELVAATPTSGRLLLLVRLTLVLGYDLALALAASAVLAVTTTTTASSGAAAGLDALIGAWLGPMALLASLSLLVAVRFGPEAALAAAVGVWALRLLASGVFALDGWPARLIVEVWSTNAAVLAVSAGFGIAAVIVAGRSGPFRGEPNRGWRATHSM